MFSGKERNPVRKMRDKEIKERGKKLLLCLDQRMCKPQRENGKMKVWP